MQLKKGQLLIAIVFVIGLIFFTPLFLMRKNYEFIVYVCVIIFFLIIILITDKKVNYPNSVLWGLTIWAILHMAGGGIYFSNVRLYEIILIPLSKSYPIFRYDQFVHIFGFGVATLVMFCILKPVLQPNLNKWTALSIVVIMAGLGVGALNEIVEFFVSVIVPQSGVGGYLNTALDLVSNFIGALIAMIFIRLKHKSYFPN